MQPPVGNALSHNVLERFLCLGGNRVIALIRYHVSRNAQTVSFYDSTSDRVSYAIEADDGLGRSTTRSPREKVASFRSNVDRETPSARAARRLHPSSRASTSRI